MLCGVLESKYRAKILHQFTKNNFGFRISSDCLLTTSDLSNLYCKTYESTRSAQFLSVFFIVANSNLQPVNTTSFCGTSRLLRFLLREQVHVTIQAHVLWRHMCHHQQLCFPNKATTLNTKRYWNIQRESGLLLLIDLVTITSNVHPRDKKRLEKWQLKSESILIVK